MDAIYIGYTFTISPLEPARDILIAELGQLGFESFVENETGCMAYIQKGDWREDILADVYSLHSKEFAMEYTFEEIAQTNWNSEWEKNFEPIFVSDKISVRAPFHEVAPLEYDIIIEPKMSFGTGHHETTHLMLEHLLALELKGKKVLDMGCGTGILAIFAAMKGATPIDAIDIDAWCYENTLENIARNNCANISAYQGDASLLEGKHYELIIANINRNILLTDMPTYAQTLGLEGTLLLSGFYTEDISLIKEAALALGLEYQSHLVKNNWVAAKFIKKA